MIEKIKWLLIVVSFIMSFGLSAQQVNLDEGLRIHLDFNANQVDLTGTRTEGVQEGSFYAMDRFGNCEYALGFDEAIQFSRLDATAPQGLQDFSVSLWFRKDQPVFGTLLSVSNTARDNELNLNINASGIFTSNIRNLPNVPGIAIVGNTSVSLGEWHHVVLTRDGTTGEARLYLDVTEDSRKVMPLGEIQVAANSFVVGNEQDCATACFDPNQQFIGAIDDLRLYDRIITQAEIQALFEFSDGIVDNTVRGSSTEVTSCDSPVTIEAPLEYDSYEWSNGQAQRSIAVTTSGQYLLTGLIGDCVYTDTVNVVLDRLPPLDITANETELSCNGEVVLTASAGFDEYIWQDGTRGRVFTTTQAGTYQVRGIASCGEALSDVVEVTNGQLATLVASAERETIRCAETLTLEANEGLTNYTWSNGERGRTIVVSAPGTYEVSAQDICGDIQNAVIELIPEPIVDFFIPNTFTPNNDGKNDFFEIDNRLQGAALKVYSRWGNQVYANPQYFNTWDGNDVKEGVYYFVVESPCITEKVRGWLKVIR